MSDSVDSVEIERALERCEEMLERLEAFLDEATEVMRIINAHMHTSMPSESSQDPSESS